MIAKAPALEKGLKILELLLGSTEALTLSQIAEGVGYKVSEVQRMVDYLSQSRYLVRTAAGAYHPGLRSYALADQRRETALVSRAAGPLQRYTLRTSESVHLGLRTERMLHVVLNADGRGKINVAVKPGVYEGDDTVSGRLLLAYAGLEVPGAEEIRDAGHAFGEVSCARGLYVIAVPISLGSEACVATLASPYLLKKDEPEAHFREDLLQELKATAAEIADLF